MVKFKDMFGVLERFLDFEAVVVNPDDFAPLLPKSLVRIYHGSKGGTLVTQVLDNGFVAESPVKDQPRPEAQAVTERLQGVNGVAGKALVSSSGYHISAQLLPTWTASTRPCMSLWSTLA